MELPAPANGLKLMIFIVAVFAVVALYGQWQHFHRASVETARIVPAPNESPAPATPSP
ncbi:MAG: hypothetical protein H0X40_06200 [Chthoniobacterales bacterium]|nr:hypothetical protein [Chthoniobacterales bacterium]